ncbi:MAG TPA: hypothetical protein VFY48_10405 [Solirubrobacterales bacterium]|nr:hypothetical protein [Solirubrobacterales bacterium]
MPNADPDNDPRLHELTWRFDAPKDEPAVPSSLHTHEEVTFELELEELRIKREERKAMAWLRRGLGLLLILAALIALVSAAVIVVGLSRGEDQLVLPAMAPLSASAATAALLWRAYAGRFLPRKST